MATQSKQKKVKGGRQKLKLFRSNEPLKSVLMWGVNYSLTQMNHVKSRAVLLNDDFKASIKVKVHNQFFNKENMPSRYKFKEYCPLVFQNLRERFNVKDSDYLNAFTKKQPEWSPDKKYLMTFDKQFIVEIISSEDVEQVHHLLEAYHEYIVDSYGKTLLPRCLAMYRLIVADQIYYMLVTKNTFSPRLPISKKYQLKGCTIDREASEKEKSLPEPMYKDLDFTNDGCKIEIGASEKGRILNLLQKDVEFLQANHMMSYSLLVGIYDPSEVPVGIPASQLSGEETAGSPGMVECHNSIMGMMSDDEGGGMLSHEEDEEDESEETDHHPHHSGGVNNVVGGHVPNKKGDESGIGAASAMSPPDSPGFNNLFPSYNGELDPDLELFGVKSTADKNLLYFMGIYHIFTRYGMKKRTAKTYKSVRHGHNAEVSTVKPDFYAKRFLEFVNGIVE